MRCVLRMDGPDAFGQELEFFNVERVIDPVSLAAGGDEALSE